MASIKIMQGDSYVIPVNLTLNGYPMTPDMVDDVEVCVGEGLRKTFSEGGVGYDTSKQRWYIRPTQEETLALEVEGYDVIARVKFSNGADVKGIKVGTIVVLDTHSEEVL